MQKSSLLISTVLLLLGMGWIAAHFPQGSLWYDETVNAYLATNNWSTIWEWSTEIDNQPPLHFILLKMWVGFIGSTEFSLRTFSALCGLLSLAGLTKLGTQLSGRALGGWFTAIIFALSGAFLYAVGEVRTYALSITLVIWATVYLWKIFIDAEPTSLYKIDRRDFVLYILLITSSFYSHYTAIFAIAVHGLFLVLWTFSNFRQKLPLTIFTGIVIALLCGIWFVILGGRDFNQNTAFAGDVEISTATETYWGFFVYGQKSVTSTAFDIAQLWIGLLLITTLLWMAIKRQDWRGYTLGILMSILPLLALLFSINNIEAKLSGRHAWVMWIGVSILIGGGIAPLFDYVSKPIVKSVIVITLLIIPIYSSSQIETLDDEIGGDFRTAFEILREEADPSDILILRDGTLFTAATYYDTPLVPILFPDTKITNIDYRMQFSEAIALIEPHINDKVDSIWVLSWQGQTQDPLEYGFAIPEYYTDGHIEIWRPRASLGAASNVSLIRYTDINPDKALITTHLFEELPDVLKIGDDGPGMIGYEFFPLISDVPLVQCEFAMHVWWWRGEVDYPDAQISFRLYDESSELIAQTDQPLTGFNFGQDDWLSNAPTLGRLLLNIPCDKLTANASYRPQLYIYGQSFDPLTVNMDSFKYINHED